MTLRQQGRVDEALLQTERGLNYTARNTTRDGSQWYWRFYLLRAEIIQQKSDSKAALSALEKDPPPAFAELRARRKQDQAYANFVVSKYAAAAALLDQAYALAQTASAPGRVASIEFLQGQVLVRMGQPRAAEQRIRDGAAQAAAAGNKEVTAYGLSSLALLLLNQSRFEDALQTLQQEYALIGDSSNHSGVAGALNNMGWCHYRLGELDRALEQFGQAQKIAAEAGDRSNLQIALGLSGNVYLDRRNFAEAQKKYSEAVIISTERNQDFWTSRWLANLARVAIQQRDWNGAADYNARALTLKKQLQDKTAELYSEVNSARIAAGQGDRAQAEAIFRRVATTGSEDAAPEMEAHAGLAELFANQGQDAQAESEYEAAFRAIERTRSGVHEDEVKINLLSSLMEVYESYIDFLMARHRTERALEVAEASRARILQERLGAGKDIKPLSAAGYRKLARDANAVLLSYWLGPKRSYLWVTTSQSIAPHTLPPEDRILSLVERYRALIENLHDPLDTGDSAGPDLYAAVLAPASPALRQGTHLILVPDRGLNALNFETLPVPGPTPHYFLQDAVISVTPSLNLLAPVTHRRATNRRLLLIGDPVSSDERYPKLPFAAKEIEFITGRFGASHVASFRNQAAAPQAYTGSAGQDFSFVHFTAHASANRESPLDSAIVLSGRTGTNLLTARDVLKQSSAAMLVTISACRSAGARTFAGEGLVGFMWAFFQAGARNVIAGLWDVSDESTPRLMDKLYAELLSGQPAAEALRAAKLDLIRASSTYRLPYYWGPFQLYVRESASSAAPRRSPTH